MSLRERAGTAVLLQQYRPTPAEDELLRSDVVRMWSAATTTNNPGSSKTNGVALATRTVAFHKAVAGIDPQQAQGLFGHEPWAVLVNESAAWMIARELGAPWSDWVPTTVIRSLWPQDPALVGGFGSIGHKMAGQPGLPQPLHDPVFCDPAALWDALVGQQDRHASNYRFDLFGGGGGALGLIDHGYAFAEPGQQRYYPHASVFVEQRHTDQRSALGQPEIQTLRSFLSNQNLLDQLASVLEAGQMQALVDRATRMESSGQLLGVLEF